MAGPGIVNYAGVVSDLEAKRDQVIAGLSKWKWILGIGAVVLLPLAVLWIVKAAVAVIAAAIGGVVIASVTPWLVAKWSNRHYLIFQAKIEQIKKQAEEDPISSAYYVLEERKKDAEEGAKDIEGFSGDYTVFEGKLGKFKRQYPDEAASFEEMRRDFKQILDDKIKAHQEVLKGIEELAAEIEKAQAKYEMAMSALNLKEKAGQEAARKVFQNIRLESSLNEVQKKLGQATATLKTQVARRAPELKMIENKPSPALRVEVERAGIVDAVPVARGDAR